MFGNRKKRRVTRIDTLIAQNSEIHGDIRFTGGLHIDGTIKGNVIAENDGCSMLSLSECGTIEGEVTVPYVILNGAVMGDVHYNLLEMAIGAEVNGKLVHSHEPIESPLAIGHGEPLEASE